MLLCFNRWTDSLVGYSKVGCRYVVHCFGFQCVAQIGNVILLIYVCVNVFPGPTDSMLLRGYVSPSSLQQAQSDSSGPAGHSAEQLVFGATCLDYRSDAGATRYLLGTEQGQGILVDRKAKKEGPPAASDASAKTIKTVFGNRFRTVMACVCFMRSAPSLQALNQASTTGRSTLYNAIHNYRNIS